MKNNFKKQTFLLIKMQFSWKINSINQQDFKVSDKSRMGLFDFYFSQTSTCETNDIKMSLGI
jgi:hypothetical protein